MAQNVINCVNYPANVINIDNAIKTLGGLSRIHQAFLNKHGKLLLNFNPDNMFTKVLCSDQQENDNEKTSNSLESFKNDQKSTCFVMKVTKCKDINGKETFKDSKIVGKVEKMLSFSKMIDFQYLPMEKQQDDTYKGFYDSFNFDNLNNYKQDLKADIPLYVLPPFFSRFDDPSNYAFRSEPTKKPSTAEASVLDDLKTSKVDESDILHDSQASTNDKQSEIDTEIDDDEVNSNFIHSVRQERSSLALLITFESSNVPHIKSEKLKEARGDGLKKSISKLTEMFNVRPCYLKSALLALTNLNASALKEALPYVAYYFTTGPWRSCWVRYGYDPRKLPEAKIYQMIDYRLRYTAEPEMHKIKPKPRAAYHKRKFRTDVSDADVSDYKNIQFDHLMYKFKPNELPRSRNVFYQICDIEDDDVQALIHSNDGREVSCTEKDGWCCVNIQDKCRNIMSAKHEQLSKKLKQQQDDG